MKKLDFFAESAISMFEHYLRDSGTYSETEKAEILCKFGEVKEMMTRG